MILSPALQILRAKLGVLVLGAVVLTAGHAMARNHDCQTFRLRTAADVLHDRAPGPTLRMPN